MVIPIIFGKSWRVVVTLAIPEVDMMEKLLRKTTTDMGLNMLSVS